MLSKHYCESSNGEFRFDYSKEFLKWALNPPGFFPDWIVGVRAKSKLMGFISAIPVNMIVNGKSVRMA